MFNPDYEFRKEIIDTHLAEKIKYCYQCNRCTDVCPIAYEEPDRYNPRTLILNSFLGLKHLILGQKDNFNIWGCQICDTCDEQCPQKIALTEIFTILKNKSVEAGEAPEYYTTQAKFILENGKAIPLAPAIERRRDQMNLPKEQKVALKEIQTILKETQLDKKIKYNWDDGK
jgi:heterodisulfide reductase subunit C